MGHADPLPCYRLSSPSAIRPQFYAYVILLSYDGIQHDKKNLSVLALMKIIGGRTRISLTVTLEILVLLFVASLCVGCDQLNENPMTPTTPVLQEAKEQLQVVLYSR